MTQETLPPPQPPQAHSGKTGRSIRVLAWLGIAGVSVLAFLCVLRIFYLVSAPGASSGTFVVEQVTWQRTIAIMGQGPVGHEDWQDRLPSDAQRGSCTRKVRSTQSQPVPGAEKICGTPHMTGQGQVVQDCQYQVYDDWCSYLRNEWTVVDTAVGYGHDVNPRWPAPNLKPGQSEGERSELYHVMLKAGKVRYTYNARDATEFVKFTPGSRWTLTFDPSYKITSVQPAP